VFAGECSSCQIRYKIWPVSCVKYSIRGVHIGCAVGKGYSTKWWHGTSEAQTWKGCAGSLMAERDEAKFTLWMLGLLATLDNVTINFKKCPSHVNLN